MKIKNSVFLFFAACLILLLLFWVLQTTLQKQKSYVTLRQAFEEASKEFGVPKELLETICYMEGNLSTHDGYPSVDNGYGCMHLIKNSRGDTLDKAASLLHVPANQLKRDMTTNIRGGAAILRDDAIRLSPTHEIPKKLGDWYGSVAQYDNPATKQSAKLYADAIYHKINTGFTAQSDIGETITLTQNPVIPNQATANTLKLKLSLPKGCVDDGQTDYPGAIDCELEPYKYDCNYVDNNNSCTYEDANRPNDYPISFIAIHYFEAYLPSAIALFHNPQSQISIHYIVDTDGTVYQITPEKDIAYHLDNYWYNQRSIGIEHTGFGPGGFRWFNAAEYLGSAKLSAYLAQKYAIALDHSHIVSHGTVPAETLDSSPNHVDPGQYWQWDRYLDLIHQQGVSFPTPNSKTDIISLNSATNSQFFPLYLGPGTRYPFIPSGAFETDRVDETHNIETNINYVYLNKMNDSAGSDEELYQIWYGENDGIPEGDPLNIPNGILNTNSLPTASNWFAHAKKVWLAVPKGDVEKGTGTIVKLNSKNTTNPDIYGAPINDKQDSIGNAPNGALFVSEFTEKETDTYTLWYEINYNHRQAWVPASEVLPE